MWDCLKTQLEKGKYVRTSPLPEWFASITSGTAVHIDKLRAQIQKLLDESRPQCKLVLIHLDEHKKMWEGEDARAIQFRRAAVQALLSVPFVRVILTFTEPPSLPPDDVRSTSALARVALPFARAAADKVALHFCPDILRMYGKPVDWTASEQRVWACCLLWVSLCIDAESPTALHRQDSELRRGFSSLTTWLQKGAKKQRSQFLAKFGQTFQKVLTWDKGQNPLDTKMVIGAALLELTLDVQMPHGRRALRAVHLIAKFQVISVSLEQIMGRGATMALRYLALLVVAAAQEPRRLKFSFGDVSYSSNGMSNSPFGQINNVVNQAQGQMVQPGQVQQQGSGFQKLSDDPFSSFGSTPKQQEAKGFALTPTNGATVLQGMIHSFLANQQLQQGERQCLIDGTGAMGSQAAAVAQNIVMIGEQVMNMQNVGQQPGIPGMPGTAGQVSTPKDAAKSMMDDTANMFDDMFGGGGGDSGNQGAQPAPNPLNMFKGFVNQEHAPAPAPAPATNIGSVQDAMAIFGMAQGRRLQMGMGMGGMGGMGMPGMPGAGGTGGGTMDPMMMMGGAAMAAQLAKQVKELGGLSHKVMQRCLKGDAQQLLHTAAARAQNPAWMQKAMVANGPKALGHMADAITAYHDGKPDMFGTATGTVMREFLLSNPDSITPEVPLPPKESLANVTGGFMDGFFGPGMRATIRTPEKPNGIKIDLNKCLGDNAGTFQNMGHMMGLYTKGGMPQTQAEKEKLASLIPWMGMQMMQVQKSCDLSAGDIQAIKDAVAGMGKGVDFNLHIPQPSTPLGKSEAMRDMAQTVSGYQKLITDPSSGVKFGQELGNIVQKVVETGFNQKYYVDSEGNLRQRLVQLSSQGQLAGAQSLTPALLVLVVVLLLLVLVAVKSRRAFAGWKEHLCQMECTESGVTDKMIPHDLDLEANDQEIKPILDEV
eukprot:s5804_g1.t1